MARIYRGHVTLTKRAADAEAALEKARDDLGALSNNTIRGIQIKSGNGSRHANGAVYIAVNFSNPYENSCRVNLSSDTALAQGHTIAIGEGLTAPTRRDQ